VEVEVDSPAPGPTTITSNIFQSSVIVKSNGSIVSDFEWKGPA
jgi:hypothetical protein